MPLEIFGTDLFNAVLSFVLVFTVIFAILEKTKIFGEERKQIDSIVALIIGLIFVTVSWTRNMITSLILIVAITSVILLLFMLLLGFVGGTTEEGKLPRGLQLTFGIIFAIVLIIAILWSAGAFPYLQEIAAKEWAPQLWQSIIFIAIIIAVVAIVTRGRATEAK